jgi:cardiolipin synthase A/B
MKLLIQPDDGARPLVQAITGARHSIELAIFRFDEREIEKALASAVGRGVAVHALIANTNRTGEENLRSLELRLLAAGVTVARTADDLARYHGKLMIIDNRELYLLAFNPTYANIERSRSFGLVTRKRALVRQARLIIESDARRQPFPAEPNGLVVSPVNSRTRLSAFISAARKELLIYDSKVSDVPMIRLLEKRAAAGVQIRIIGHLTGSIPGATVRKLAQIRLHTRTMIRDGRMAFIGSQSLRPVELDGRREVGLIFSEPKLVARLQQVFNSDWAAAGQAAERAEKCMPVGRVAKKVAKLLAKELPEVSPALTDAVKKIAAANGQLAPEVVAEALKGAVRTAVQEAVKDVMEEAAEGCPEPTT